MKIVIPGGSGQVGTVLARAFHGDGHDVVVLSRQPRTRPWRVASWDGSTPGGWFRELDGADVVINLAGRSVNCRYHAANRKEMIDSRVQSTRVVGGHPLLVQACQDAVKEWRFVPAPEETIQIVEFDFHASE